MKPIKIYFDSNHYEVAYREYLHPLLRPFIGKPVNFGDTERQKIYGLTSEDFSPVPCPEKATVAVLPMAWNYYQEKGNVNEAFSFYEKCEKKHLKVFSWVSGDFGVKAPDLNNLIVHRTSGYRSKLPDNHRGMPVFISDPLKKWYKRDEVLLRKKGAKPVVGFCGQAQGSPLKYCLDITRTAWNNAKFHLGQTLAEPQSLYPSTLLRARVLKRFESCPKITSNFIKRKKYRAGIYTKEERKKTTLEFFDNMVNSDYVVCVRGGGNFSVRLYETLAMGRIPVFVDTDCLLPISENLFWEKNIVKIPNNKIGKLSSYILPFHKHLSSEFFFQLQLEARNFWKQNMTLKSFFKQEVQ